MSPRARSIELRRGKRKRAAEAEAAQAAAEAAARPVPEPIGLLPVDDEEASAIVAARAASAAARMPPEAPLASTAEVRVTRELAGESACPKHMVFGPCGGVGSDGSCEVGGPCPFVGPNAARVPTVEPVFSASLTPAAEQIRLLMQRRTIVVADLPSAGPNVELERRLANALAGSVDAALLGDSPWARLQFPPALRASLVSVEGVRPWCGLNCRDRNRVALQAELAALAATGVGAVHCVTGDHPQAGRHDSSGAGALAASSNGRPSPGSSAAAPGVFDLDSTQLASLAASTGLVVSVAESPSAPPVEGRPGRAAAKAEAGASICFVNHAGSAAELREFVARTRELSPNLRIIVCVPMVLSRGGADRLAEFLPGALPPSVAAVLRSADPVATAIATAVHVGSEYLEIDGVDGIDLSAPPARGEELIVAQALASVGRALGGAC